MVLARSARRRSGVPRQARFTLAVGLALAVVPLLTLRAAGLLTGAGGDLWVAEPGHQGHSGHPVDPGQETAAQLVVAGPPRLALVVAVGTAVVVAGLLVGLAGLARVSSYGGELLRHGLDAAAVAGALALAGWVAVDQLIFTPDRLPWPPQATLTCPAGVVASVTLVVTVGMVVTGFARAAAPRTGVVAAGSGVCLIAAGGCAIALGYCWVMPDLITAGGWLAAAGALAVPLVARTPDAAPGDGPLALRGGAFFLLVPIAMASTAGLFQAATAERFGLFAAVAVVSVGFALVVRHHLTLADARRYADRLAQREAHFRLLAHTDPLTGLANRRGLLTAMPARTRGDAPCVLLALDLDGFKDVNDMRGHDIGDAVLMEVGRRLRAHVRPGDLAARLGGDEFAVVMPTVPARAQAVAERLLAVLSQPYQLPSATIFLSVSIGLAGSTTAEDVPGLLRNADLALRYAKQQGKGRVEEYDAAYDALLRRRTTLDHELRGAIDRGEMHLVFQPVVALPSIRPAGAEALLRWHHPELGQVPPGEFIPVAEESGMISALGRWVLHQACHQLSRLLAEGYDIWVSVNVSPRELRRSDYVAQVSEALAAHRVPPQRLVLEVTEHAVAADLAELICRLTALRETGVRIALDDFGAGYSSLGQLHRLPVDLLKLDHRLVDDGAVEGAVAGRRRVAPLVEVVVRLGQRLGLEVIAEGICDPDHLATVTDAGCRFGQGRLLGLAVPAEHLEAQLAAADFGGGLPRPGASYARPYQRLGRLDSGAEMRHS